MVSASVLLMIDKPLIARLQEEDYDRFLSVLFSPREYREGLSALYAFNLELAKIFDVTSEPALGQIRLQWWRDALDEIVTGKPPRQHDVVLALAELNASRPLSESLLLQMIDAREQDISGVIPDVTEAFTDYVTGTSAALLQQVAMMTTEESAPYQEVIHQIGRAYGTIGLLRSAHRHLPRGRCHFPRPLLEQYGLSLDHFGSQPFLDGFRALTERLVEESWEQLQQARRQIASMPKSIRTSLMPVCLFLPLTEWYIRQIRRCHYDPLSSVCPRPAAGMMLSLWWKALRSRP